MRVPFCERAEIRDAVSVVAGRPNLGKVPQPGIRTLDLLCVPVKALLSGFHTRKTACPNSLVA
jgi:hypothetical protein